MLLELRTLRIVRLYPRRNSPTVAKPFSLEGGYSRGTPEGEP